MTDPNTPNVPGNPDDSADQLANGLPEEPAAPSVEPPAAPDVPPPAAPPTEPPAPPAAPPEAPPSYGAPETPAPPYGAPAAPPPPAYGAAPAYGAPPPGAPGGPAYGAPAYAGQPPAAKSPVLSIISLIAGIVGFILAWIFGSGILFSIAAVVLGFLGRKKEPAAKGMWLTGLILGFVGIAIALIFIVISIIALIAWSTSGVYYRY